MEYLEGSMKDHGRSTNLTLNLREISQFNYEVIKER
jgi:hypothetical protein